MSESDKPSTDYKTYTDAEWKEAGLTDEQIQVTRHSATEPPFSSPFEDKYAKGIYSCVCCGAELFRSDYKFDSGCGWPSFYKEENKSMIEVEDMSTGVMRIEVRCSNCDAHLGHRFEDAHFCNRKLPSGITTRFCINGLALNFKPAK